MLYRLLLILTAAVMFAAIPGCKKTSDSDTPQVQAPQVQQQTEITKENLSSELDKMEQEINTDATIQE